MSIKIYHIALLSPGQPNSAIGREFSNAANAYQEIDWVAIRNTYGLPYLRHRIIFEVQEFRPDIIFMQLQTADVIDKQTARKLCAICPFVVNWTGDVRKNIDWYIELADSVHTTLFTNLTDVYRMRNRGKVSDYLQIGFDDEIYRPEGTLNTLFNNDSIVFMGNNYIKNDNMFPGSQERVTMVNFMRSNFADFKVFGTGWTNAAHLDPLKEAQSYRSSKIGINQNHFDYINFSSDRILRIMGCGCFCASKYYPGLETEYVIGKDLVVWNSFEELKEICEYYLLHPEEREAIASSGMKLVREHYTWKGRTQQLLTMFETHKNKK